jgi:hypothetical protein
LFASGPKENDGASRRIRHETSRSIYRYNGRWFNDF